MGGGGRINRNRLVVDLLHDMQNLLHQFSHGVVFLGSLLCELRNLMVVLSGGLHNLLGNRSGILCDLTDEVFVLSKLLVMWFHASFERRKWLVRAGDGEAQRIQCSNSVRARGGRVKSNFLLSGWGKGVDTMIFLFRGLVLVRRPWLDGVGGSDTLRRRVRRSNKVGHFALLRYARHSRRGYWGVFAYFSKCGTRTIH